MAGRLVRIFDNRLILLALCAAFTVGMIFNWVFPLGALLYTRGIDGNDCGQMVWNIWYANESISKGHNPYFTDLVYFPVGANLAHHTLAPGFFPLTFVVKQFSGGNPMYPLYTYRLLALICFTLILYFSFLFLREVGITRWAAAAAAVAHSFSHFYMAHVMHINHLAGFLIPLTGLIAVKAYRSPGKRLIMLAFIAGISVYFTEFSLYVYMAVAIFIVALVFFEVERALLLQKLKQTGPLNVILGVIVFFVLVGPFAINLIRDKALKPPLEQSSIWSGNLAGFFVPDAARTPIYGHLFESLNKRVTIGVGGFEMFLGYATILFAVVALFKVKNRYVRICACIGGLFLLLSLGGSLKIFGLETKFPMPYALLMRVPPFDSGRTPVRFIVMGLFFLMVVAAHGLVWFQHAVRSHKGLRWSYASMILVFVWITGEVYQPIAKQQVFTLPSQLQKLAPGPVFELPLLAYDGYASLLQVFHHRPIATGYLARISQRQLDQATMLRQITDRGPTFCEEIKRLGYRNIIISPNGYMEPYDPGGVTQLELEKCSLPVIDLRSQGVAMPNHPNFVIRDGREEPIQFPMLAAHTRLLFSNEDADQYLWYGWSGREVLSHWTNCGKAAIVFGADDQTRSKGGAKLRIFGGPFLAPGKVDVQRIRVELNDQKLAELTLNTSEPSEHVLEVPAGLLLNHNTLVLRMPDAVSPRALGVSEDWRLLGLNVQWIAID